MITVQEAKQIIAQTSLTLKTEKITLHNAIGHYLARDVKAQRSYPPFDRVAMDGIAINYQTAIGNQLLAIEGICAAGDIKSQLSDPNNCLEVMTGAILPSNSDTVIRYEDLKKIEDSYAIQKPFKKGQNIHKKGTDYSTGEILLKKFTKINPEHIAILASEGFVNIEVFKWPKLAIISTGNELVNISEVPEEHQIRRSNVHMIASALKALRIESDLYHFNDEIENLTYNVRQITQDYDILLLSGGVSKGKFDFVPDALSRIGVKKKIHRVKQKPGKPFWFGTNQDCIVFAFPGNPVSSFVCYLKYFKPWLLNQYNEENIEIQVLLNSEFSFQAPLHYFAQAKLIIKDACLYAEIIKGNGSGDFINLKNVDGFIEFPSSKNHFMKGELFNFIPFDK